MKNTTMLKSYQAAIYLRLSQEDGDLSSSSKYESNSISTQRELLMAYLQQHPEISFVQEFCDDGYTGTNFDRPGFLRMMEAVKDNRINCIVVKDLSRFGRDYIETGKYTQKIFPSLGIRFIAVNDSIDSADTGNQANDFILPFKNLINDSYCRDISIKSRTNLEVKRQNGEFVNNYAVYGYRRSTEDRHKLVVDEEAASVVRDIFRWKEEGWNAQKIADTLNETGILSPMEYKKKCGIRFQTSFKTGIQAKWSAVAILRILKNPVYTGTLIQGRTTTPNYKVKIRQQKDESEWARIDHAHEAIIPYRQFDLVQELLKLDTRRASTEETVYLFSGLLYCADCGNPMIHRSVASGGKKYRYFTCGGNRQDKRLCSSHRIRCELVEEAVLATVQAHISTILDMDKALTDAQSMEWEQRECKKIGEQISALEGLVEKYSRLKLAIYEDKKKGILSQEDYHLFHRSYEEKIQEQKEVIAKLERKRTAICSGETKQQSWFSQFRQYQNIESLSRLIVVNLITRIEINAEKEIHVTFRYQDQFATALQFCQSRLLGTETEQREGV